MLVIINRVITSYFINIIIMNINNIKIIAGIDYSYTCPSLCIHKGNEWDYNNCSIYFLSQTKKYEGVFDNIYGIPYPFNYNSPEERYDKISNIFIDILQKESVQRIAVEGYSYGSKGSLIFNIAENGGIFKHKLYKFNIPFIIPPPTHIKKYATGKGNSNKNIMYEQFENENNVLLPEKIGYNKSVIGSPLGDIVDAYYICKYCFDN